MSIVSQAEGNSNHLRPWPGVLLRERPGDGRLFFDCRCVCVRCKADGPFAAPKSIVLIGRYLGLFVL